jgi:hypothetical protein
MENQYRLSPEFSDKLPSVPAPRSWARIVAREWLLFLGCLVFTMALIEAILIFQEIPHTVFYYLTNYDDHDRSGRLIAWLWVCAVYVTTQFLRSVRWAIKTVRRKQP